MVGRHSPFSVLLEDDIPGRYSRIACREIFPAIEENGEKKKISLGQNAARMSEPEREVRLDAFMKMEKAWEPQANLAAMALNSQAGFRLSIYKNRNWDSPLFDPLLTSRLKRETLDAMWQAIVEGRAKIADYVKAKMRLLSIDKFCWYDQTAPV